MNLPYHQKRDVYLQNSYIKKAANILQTGGLVAFPTETVYGLGADATNEAAVKKIFQAKGRPSDNPLIVHLAKMEQIGQWVKEISPLAKRLIKHFSPGPITYVMEHQGTFAENVTAGLSTVGIRIPEHELALALLELTGIPIAAPSANRSGRPSPTSAAHVKEDLNGKVDIILNGGSTSVGVESTVVDVTGEIPILLRPGGVTLEDLQAVVGEVIVDAALQDKPRSPGMKYRHYAPKGELWLADGVHMRQKIQNISQEKAAAGFRVGILTTMENQNLYKDGTVIACGFRAEPSSVAQQLYDALRQFDEMNIDIIFAETFPSDGMFRSVMNRLVKASEGKYL
jgi:L-threonylcarbamoyladenylate synthase